MVTAEQVQSLLGSSFVQWNLKRLAKKDGNGRSRIDNVMAAYTRDERIRFTNIPYYLMISLLPAMFKVKRAEIEDIFNQPFYRKAINNVARSVPELGLSAPQKFISPILVVWNFTNVCNLNCVHCYQDAHRALPDELTLEERLMVIDELYKNNVASLAFSGGEPLMHKDFWPVAKYAHEKGLHISVATNGTLITKEVAARLKETGVNYVEISIDSTDPKKHDIFRGGKGLWEKSIQGIKNCAEVEGMDVGMASTVTRRNFGELTELIDLATDLKTDSFYAFNYIPAGRGKALEEEDLTPGMREEMLRILHTSLLDENKVNTFSTCTQFGRYCIENAPDETVVVNHYGYFKGQQAKMLCEYIGGCGAGRLYCAVQPNGKVTPCVFMPEVVGDLRKNTLEEIWRNSRTMDELRDRTLLKEHCVDCENRTLCGGCRARAYGYFGDHLAPDPGCIYNTRAWDELVAEHEASLQEETAN
jgi:radical SAM protein with 4Fe4S-binding SPASM domain